MADTDWRYRAGNNEQGPITAEELCRLFAAGTLRLDTIVWCPPIRQWVPAGTIPGFRQAAAAAPPCDHRLAPPPLARLATDFYDKAARAAWIAPLLAIALTFCFTAGREAINGGAPAQVTAQAINGCICGALILCGLFAGVTALLGTGGSRRSILAPALIGVVFNSLIILTGIWTISAARSASARPVTQAQLYQEGISSAEDFPGWIGAAKLPGGAIVVGSLDDQSPAARRVLDELTTPCSVVTITISNSNSASPVALDPSSLRLLSTQGTIDVLSPDDVLANIRQSASGPLHKLAAPQIVPAGERACVTVCFIPRGIDLHQVAAVTVRLNGQKMTIPGRFFSAPEKQKKLQSVSAIQPAIPSVPSRATNSF